MRKSSAPTVRELEIVPRAPWLLPLVAVLAGCTGLGSAKPYRPQSPPEFRTAAASIMGKDVNNSFPDDPDNPNPRIRLQPSPGKAPLIGNRPVEVLASNNKSGAYVAFTGQVPVTQFFQVLRRADCNDWVYLQPIAPFVDYYTSGDYTGDKATLKCLSKVHERYRSKTDERLTGSDGVVFDAQSAKFTDRDDSAYGPRKIHMDGWAVKFVEPTAADIEARINAKPLSPIEIVQFKTAAYWVAKHRVAAFAPALRKALPLASPFAALNSWGETEHAALRALVIAEPADASIDPYVQILEAGIAKMLVPGSQYAVSGLKVGNAPFLAANVLVCRNEPGTAEFLERVMLNATIYQHKMAAVKALVAMGKSDVVGKSLTDGKLGNISTKVSDLLAGRDPFPFTCPMAPPNG